MRCTRRNLFALVATAALSLAGPALAVEIHVMSSGGLTASFQALAPVFERKTGHTIRLVLGPSMGTAEDAIPVRLKRGEAADLLLMVGYALGGLVEEGVVAPESRVDLANSKIAMAVRAGEPKPDIGTLDAFKAALLGARSIGYSDSASGVYIEREMYRKLGLHDELAPRSRMIVSERVGNVVARGDVQVGFQQVSELLPVKGIQIVGPVPDEVQSVTVFSAGIPAASREPGAARDLVAFLRSDEGVAAMRASGLEPIVDTAK